MDERDLNLVVPDECVRWCRAQDYGLAVLDDMAAVDLDWWNHRLSGHDIGVRLAGRDADGKRIGKGVAAIRRGDLRPHSGLIADGPSDIGLLYLAAAWLFSHRDRARARRFFDVGAGRATSHRFWWITTALAACAQSPTLVDSGASRTWSGWPKAPGVGPSLLSLYCWAVHEGAPYRPQLLDQQGVATLLHLGWLANPAVGQFTVARYRRYGELVQRWADQAAVAPELIEMWLVHDWRERDALAMRSGDRHPSI